MRCINMKIIGVSLFLINLMVIKSNVIPKKDETSQPVGENSLNKFEKDCPDFWKIIQRNNLTEWTNCQAPSGTVEKATEEEVLKFACFLAKNMMIFICENKINFANQYLRLQEEDNLCPFQFPQLINNSTKSHLAKELVNVKPCNKVCNDLYEPRIQCVILRKFNNYLISYEKQSSRLGLVLPREGKSSGISTPIQKVALVNDKLNEKKTSKETTTKIKMETISNKGAASSVKVQSNETKKPESKTPEEEVIDPKIPEPKNPEPENLEPKDPKNENLDPDKPPVPSPKTPKKSEVSKIESEIPEEENNELKSSNDDFVRPDVTVGDVSSIDSVDEPLKDSINEITELQKVPLEEENGKVPMQFNQQDISANGFLPAEDSHFFFYFIVVSSVIVIAYIGFHNKNKILAYALEGTSGRRPRRRPNPARYRKLETNLEEAISSNASETITSSVVY